MKKVSTGNKYFQSFLRNQLIGLHDTKQSRQPPAIVATIARQGIPKYACSVASPHRFVPWGRNVSTCMKLESPKAREIMSFLQMKNIKAQPGPTCFICDSVFPKSTKLGRPRKGLSGMTLFINKMTGYFFCIESGRRGSWEELKEYVNLPMNKKLNSKLQYEKNLVDTEDSQQIKKIWENDSVPLTDISGIPLGELLLRFNLDRIPLSDLEHYGIRTNKNAEHIVIPWFTNTNHVGSHKQLARSSPIGLKIFSAKENKNATGSSASYDVICIPQSYWCLIGLSQVISSTRKIVLTMNEFDAIAINSFSESYKAVSLPSGATYLPLEALPYLEQFTEIIIWFDNDFVSWEAARKFSKKLDEKRCRLIRPAAGSPSPLRAVSDNQDVDKIISSAISAEIKNIVSFSDLRSYIKDELTNCDTVCGVKWKRYPQLNDKLKGHRRGELTVVTGPTGSGKTTFMSEYSLDLVTQGVSTLWGSFEIQNVRLAKMMMKQFARMKLEENMSDFEEVANRFQTLPIHFMTYNGPQGIKDVILTMRQAAYVYDIQHIVIDNLQFMMGTMPRHGDRFTVQDMLIGEFRNFATAEHIHVSIVIHPRKEDDGLPLQISSIFGTAKATQEADNIIILQQAREISRTSQFKRKYIEIAKNRYDGELGKFALHFDKNSLCMSKEPIVDVDMIISQENSLQLTEGSQNLNELGVKLHAEEDGTKLHDNEPTNTAGISEPSPSWFADWRGSR